MARFNLTNLWWAVVQPLLPTKVGKRVDDRRMLDEIFRQLRTGAACADNPALRRLHGLREPFPAGHFLRVLKAIS